MPVGIEAWITQIPPITRAWLALSVLISLAVVRRTRTLVYSRLTCPSVAAMSAHYSFAAILQP